MVDLLAAKDSESIPVNSPSASVHPVHTELEEAMGNERADEGHSFYSENDDFCCFQVTTLQQEMLPDERNAPGLATGGGGSPDLREESPLDATILISQPSQDWFRSVGGGRGLVVEVTYIGDVDEIIGFSKKKSKMIPLVSLPKSVGKRRSSPHGNPASFSSALPENAEQIGDPLEMLVLSQTYSDDSVDYTYDPYSAAIRVASSSKSNSAAVHPHGTNGSRSAHPPGVAANSSKNSKQRTLLATTGKTKDAAREGVSSADEFDDLLDSVLSTESALQPMQRLQLNETTRDLSIREQPVAKQTKKQKIVAALQKKKTERNTPKAQSFEQKSPVPDQKVSEGIAPKAQTVEPKPKEQSTPKARATERKPKTLNQERTEQHTHRAQSVEHKLTVERVPDQKNAERSTLKAQLVEKESTIEKVPAQKKSERNTPTAQPVEQKPLVLVKKETKLNTSRSQPEETPAQLWGPATAVADRLAEEPVAEKEAYSVENVFESSDFDQFDELDDLLESVLGAESDFIPTESRLSAELRQDETTIALLGSVPTEDPEASPQRKAESPAKVSRKHRIVAALQKKKTERNGTREAVEEPVQQKPEKRSTLSITIPKRHRTVPQGPNLATSCRPSRAKPFEKPTASPPRPLSLIVPHSPSFDTPAQLGEPKRATATVSVTLAQSTNVLRHELRSEQCKIPSPSHETTPRAPFFATTDLLDEPKRSPPSSDIPAAQSTDSSPHCHTVPSETHLATTDELGEPKRSPPLPSVTTAEREDVRSRSLQKESANAKSPANCTVPHAPHFATTDLLGEPSLPPGHQSSLTLAQSTEMLKKNLRRPEIATKSPSRGYVTVPRGPHLQTEERLGRKNRKGECNDYTLAQSSERLQKELRRETPTHWKPHVTTPRAPHFHQSASRHLPKSSAEKEEEMMKSFRAHPFKAAPIMPSSVGGQQHPKQRAATVPKPFTFHGRPSPSKTRASPPRKAAEPEHFTFRARPMPDFGTAKTKSPTPKSVKLSNGIGDANGKTSFENGLPSTKTV